MALEFNGRLGPLEAKVANFRLTVRPCLRTIAPQLLQQKPCIALGSIVIRIGCPRVQISSQSRKTIRAPVSTSWGKACAYAVSRCEIYPTEENGNPNCPMICEMLSSEQYPSNRSKRICRSTSVRSACTEDAARTSNA